MRISAKGRYALAAMLEIAQRNAADDPVAIVRIAERLGISKIYLEQVFSLLKRAGLVISVKGAQGGYRLAAPPEQISAYAILAASESALTEQTEPAAAGRSSALDAALREGVFDRMDCALRQSLSAVTLAELTAVLKSKRQDDDYMYFI